MSTCEDAAAEALSTVVRQDWGRLVALLLARHRRLDLVEEALADAVEAASRRWSQDGVPGNPAGWLVRVAQRKIIDQFRAEAMRRHKHVLLATDLDRHVAVDAATVAVEEPRDERLRLVLMCCHPALNQTSAAALALRLVVGLPTADIARLFLASEATMAARLTRAKRRVATAGIPFAVPTARELPGRLATVAQVAYLAFTAGYAPFRGPELVGVELAGEAIRLTKVVHQLCPDEPTLQALLALQLLQHSRRDARVDDHGAVVVLADQDRSRWRGREVSEALTLLQSSSLSGPLPAQAASYLLQARIAAEHARAPSAELTDWPRIVRWYDQLMVVDPSPAAQLARAVAIAEASGPGAGLRALESVDYPGSHRVHLVRAELLGRDGQSQAACQAMITAIEQCPNEAERGHLSRRLAELSQRS